jgi:ribulose-phosphate 3-epimerase
VIGSGNFANLPGLDIQVDGGINYQTAAECVKAGANVLAAGSYLYKSDNPAHSIKELRALRR